MWLLVSEWLQSIPQIAVCRHTPYWAIPPLILCDKQQEPSWDAAERAQERREDALSSPPPLRKVTGAQDSLPLHLSSAFLPAPPQPSLTTVIIMNGCGANPEVSAASSQRLRFTPFECAASSSSLWSGRWDFQFWKLFRVSIFEMCVTCFFVFFLRVDFKRGDAASHFQSSASAMARFSPISVKADKWRREEKKKSELNALAD